METSYGLDFIRNFGEHTVLSINDITFGFKEYFTKIFSTNDLENLHLKSFEYNQFLKGDISNICDYETDLHKIFYMNIKKDEEFKRIYCNLISQIHRKLFPDEKYIIYQSFPSVRFQFPNSVAVPPHYDSDELGKHPIGEKNFLIPITSMFGTKSLFIESEPGKNDFKGIDLSYGEILFFNGNTCTHYNEINLENTLRISLDFRVILKNDYLKYILNNNVSHTNPRDPFKQREPVKMIIGGYYQISQKDDTIERMISWHFQKKLLLQSRPHFDEEEASACYNYIKNDNFLTEFTQTERFEKELSNFTGSRNCIVTTSGTSALLLGLMALEFNKEDEIIVPNYTMIATINAIKFAGATPVIADINNETFTISIENIQHKLNKNTKAIIHVSLNNRHHNLDEIKQFCDSNNILLIEDAAQSLGCFINNRHFGTFGTFGIFSLSTPKIISTGQGGFIVTDNDLLAKKIRMMKNFGRKESGNDIFELFGINMKFTDIQAVIGLEQLKKLPNRIERLRRIFDLYYSQLSGNCKMIPPQSSAWIPWFVDIFINNRDELINFLKIHNIQTRPTYPEINKTPMYYDDYTMEVSNYVSKNGLFLPTHVTLTDREILHICNLINLFLD